MLVHNDLHADHILLPPNGLLGIIDWGSVGMGGPDTDFLLLYWAFGVKFLEACASAYGYEDMEMLRWKLDDLCLLFMLFLIVDAPAPGSEEDEVSAWEFIAHHLEIIE